MAQNFILRLAKSGDATYVDFINASTGYKLEEGGFNISLPQGGLELAKFRPAPLFIPIKRPQQAREASIRFSVYAPTRKGVIQKLSAIRKMLSKAEARMRFGAGDVVELQYAWEGADNITYFEVYGGFVNIPDDTWSPFKMLRIEEGNYWLAGVELTLYVSQYGYACKLTETTGTEVPLYNPTVGGKQTGGVNVKNHKQTGASTYTYEYVKVEASDLDGSDPFLTIIKITPISNAFDDLYIGVDSELPSKRLFEGEALTGYSRLAQSCGSGYCSGATSQYGQLTIPGGPGIASTPGYWSLGASLNGMFYGILHFHSYPDYPNYKVHFGLGYYDQSVYHISEFGELSKAKDSSCAIPLGPIQIPPGGREVKKYLGDNAPDARISLWAGNDEAASKNVYLDCMYLLPISLGFRIWKKRGPLYNYGTTYFYDNGLLNYLYVKSGSYQYTSFSGFLNPIRLEPGIDQYVFFKYTVQGTEDLNWNAENKIQIYKIPCYQALAE